MRRRQLLSGVAVAAVGGCSTREGDGTDSTDSNTTPTSGLDEESATPTDTPVQPARETVEAGTTEEFVESARTHLTVAFDELREMRPVGPDFIRVSEGRFQESDHEVVRDRIGAAVAALDRATGANGDPPESVQALRTTVTLARAGLELYAAVRRGIRAEWQFEYHSQRAEWPAAREQARKARQAVVSWARHGQAVTEAAKSTDEAVKTAEGANPVSISRLSLRAWYRDGAVLDGVSGPWGEVLAGFGSFAEAVRLDEAGLAAMDAGEYRSAREQFSTALTSVREAHRSLARAKADGAQGFQAFALPIRQRCGPFAKAYTTQLEAAQAAVSGETDRAETMESKAMDRIVEAELESPLPSSEG